MAAEKSNDESTPLLKQYWEIKAQAGDALLFFRMGDFYELFGDDAVTASKVLGITLTSRDKHKENPLPMAGVPWHSSQNYLQKLLNAGYRVAIAEQVEDPETAKANGKSIVKREIIRTFSPAVQFGEETRTAYLGTITLTEEVKNYGVISLLDPATGELKVSEPAVIEKLLNEIDGFPIKHFLIRMEQEPALLRNWLKNRQILIEELPANYIRAEQAASILTTSLEVQTLAAFFTNEEAITAAGTLAYYVARTQKLEKLSHLQPPRAIHSKNRLRYGAQALRHLDLVPQPETHGDLFTFLNHAKTSSGSRELRRWIEEPLVSKNEITARHEAIQELSQNPQVRAALQKTLGVVYDLERLSGRLATGLASPRDLLSLSTSLSAAEALQNTLSALQCGTLKNLQADLANSLAPLGALIQETNQALVETPPTTQREGGIFKKGYHSQLDHFISLCENGESWMIEYETKEREATKIPSLKVKYNRVFGYSIEITHTHSKNVPPHYHRKQTMANAERFITEELKKFEEELFSSSEKRRKLEEELFQNLLEQFKAQLSAIHRVSHRISELDVYQTLSALLDEPGWCLPELNAGNEIILEDSMHPMVAKELGGKYVPNTIEWSAQNILLITGPNMGGKSTFMRQVALTIVLSQMGAPVPARIAKLGIFDSIYSRLGAQDAITQGQSTFMVEMTELAHLIQNATSRSLLVLDEIGRGTSTYDGMSVAWSSLEWIATQIRSKTMFATHYHELTALSGKYPEIRNVHFSAESKERSAELRFLYQIEEGPANESFGIQVAQMAGLPKPLIKRAWQILERLEAQNKSPEAAPQLSLFGAPVRGDEIDETPKPVAAPIATPAPAPDPIRDELKQIDTDALTPLDALRVLAGLKMKLSSNAKPAVGELSQ